MVTDGFVVFVRAGQMREERLASAFWRVDVTCMQGLGSSSSSSTVEVHNTGYHQYRDMAQPALPDDILHLLCEELASQDQFDTLFNCACANRILAVPALTHLYR